MSATYIHTKRKLGFTKILLRASNYLYFALLAAVIVYLWLFTQNRYLSTAEFKVSHHGATGNEVYFAPSMMPGNDPASVDSQLVIGFVNSAGLLQNLEKKYQLLTHFQSPTKDWVFRLKQNPTLEERFIFYRKRIFAQFNVETGLTVLSVDTYDPKLSLEIANDIMKQAEIFMNTISRSIAEKRLDFVKAEVEYGAKAVDDLTAELINLQNENNFINPSELISATLIGVQKIRMDRMQAETELSTLQRLSPNSPRIENLRSRLSSLEEQYTTESEKLSGPEQNSLNQLLAKYRILEQKLEFATKVRNESQMTLERNRVAAIADSRYLTMIQQPYLPEDVGLPQRPYATVTLLILGGLVFLIFRAIIKAIFSMV